MRRRLACCVAGFMLFSIVACSGATSTSTPTDNASQPVITTLLRRKPITITADFEVEWWSPHPLGADEWFEVLGWEIDQDQKHTMDWTKDSSFVLSHRQFCGNAVFNWIEPHQSFYMSVRMVRARDGQLLNILSLESTWYPWNTNKIEC